MQIIKPKKLSILTKPYRFRGEDRLVVAALCFFKLGKEGTAYDLLSEEVGIKLCQEALGQTPLDMVMPKPRAEFLAMGCAYAGANQSSSIDVSISVSGQAKHLRAFLQAGAKQTCVSLDYSNAYGGPGYAGNPLGKGHDEDQEAEVFYRDQCRELQAPRGEFIKAASFAPQGIDWPVNLKLGGSYDEQWFQHDYPGLPRDIDWRFFNLSAEDQQRDAFFVGGEEYQIEGMHPEEPCLRGEIPCLTIRAFAQSLQAGEKGFKEIKTRGDTLWLFPEKTLGVLICRGEVPVSDIDAEDVTALMLAYENKGDQARGLEYYRGVMAKRCNKETAMASTFNESELSPLPSVEEVARKTQGKEDYVKAEKKRRQGELENLLTEMEKELGVDLDDLQKSAGEQAQNSVDYPPLADTLQELPDPSLMISPEELASGDFDLTECLAAIDQIGNRVEQLTEDLSKDAEIRLTEAKSLAPEKGSASGETSAYTPLELNQGKEAIRRQSANVVKGLLAVSEKQAALTSSLPALDAGLDAPTLKDEDLKAVLENQQQTSEFAGRLGKLFSPVSTADEAELHLKQHLGAYTREIFSELMAQRADMSGRDFSGIDLSGMQMAELDLSECLFEGANLSGAVFQHCTMKAVIMTGAILDQAVFNDCDLEQANLSDCQGSHACFDHSTLSHSNVIGLKLTDSTWRGACLSSLALIESDIKGADFTESEFQDCTLTKSDISGAGFKRCQCHGLNFNNVDLKQADFRQSEMQKVCFLDCRLEEADFSQAKLHKTTVLGTTGFTASLFVNAEIRESGWAKASFENVCFKGASVVQSDFSNTAFIACDLEDVCFYQTLLSGGVFENASAQEIDFHGSLLRKAVFKQIGVARLNLYGADITDLEFDEVKIQELVIAESRQEQLHV